jgi:hypothetical protein
MGWLVSKLISLFLQHCPTALSFLITLGDIVLPSKLLLPFLVEKPQHCPNFWHQSLLNTLGDIVSQKISFLVKENVRYVIQFILSSDRVSYTEYSTVCTFSFFQFNIAFLSLFGIYP